MEPCFNTKFHAFEEPTDIPQRMVVSLMNVRTIDVEFSDITLNVPDGVFSRSESCCSFH